MTDSSALNLPQAEFDEIFKRIGKRRGFITLADFFNITAISQYLPDYFNA
jgi:hypothetical protein